LSIPTPLRAATGRHHYPLSGWLEAWAYVVVLTLLNLIYAIGHSLGAHAGAFILESMLIGSVALILVGEKGPSLRAILSTWQTWAFGWATVLTEFFFYLLIGRASPAEASLLTRLSLPIALLIGWIGLRRVPVRQRRIGAAIVTAALAGLIAELPAGSRLTTTIYAVLASLAIALRAFFAEFHPWNRSAQTVRGKMAVTGKVVLATTALGLLLMAGHQLLEHAGLMGASRFVPTLAELLHGPTLALALLMGVAVITAMQYLIFSSSVKITSENFSAVNAFVPVTTLIANYAIAALGLVARPSSGLFLATLMAITIAGVMLVLRAPAPRRKSD